jgi:hypothetical protein
MEWPYGPIDIIVLYSKLAVVDDREGEMVDLVNVLDRRPAWHKNHGQRRRAAISTGYGMAHPPGAGLRSRDAEGVYRRRRTGLRTDRGRALRLLYVCTVCMYIHTYILYSTYSTYRAGQVTGSGSGNGQW